MKRYVSRQVPPLSRRDFLAGGLALGAAGVVAGVNRRAFAAPEPERQAVPRKLRVAAINSIFRLRSHSYHILGRKVYGFQKDGLHHQPDLQVVRMFNDQYPADDLSRGFCKAKGIELCQTASETLGKGGGLDVDAVALIVEHGDYPLN